MSRTAATCWTCLLLSAFLLCEPVLSKGGRGGARGSSRGTSSSSSSSRGSTGGNHFRGGHGGTTRSRFRAPGRSSASRVAGAAAAGAVVALAADGWYASAYRRSSADSSDDDMDYYNRTSYYESLMSGSAQDLPSLTQILSIVVATFSPKIGYLLDIIL